MKRQIYYFKTKIQRDTSDRKDTGRVNTVPKYVVELVPIFSLSIISTAAGVFQETTEP